MQTVIEKSTRERRRERGQKKREKEREREKREGEEVKLRLSLVFLVALVYTGLSSAQPSLFRGKGQPLSLSDFSDVGFGFNRL
jgi:hypothetical protein